MTHPNPKSGSKCCKMPKSNFSFLGATFMVGGYAEITHPNPKSCSKCHKIRRSNFLIFGCDVHGRGMLKIPHPNLKIQISKCSYEIEIHKFPFQA